MQEFPVAVLQVFCCNAVKETARRRRRSPRYVLVFKLSPRCLWALLPFLLLLMHLHLHLHLHPHCWCCCGLFYAQLLYLLLLLLLLLLL